MRALAICTFAGLFAMTVSACASQTTRPDHTSPPPRAAIPASCPLSKIKEGMDMKEVADLIGQPTDTDSHVTGKAFIPFYYGADRSEIEAHYKGMGRVVYAGSSGYVGGSPRVIEVQYDPSESGYSR